MSQSVRQIMSQDGLLGILESTYRVVRKFIYTFYYRFRFKSFGAGSLVTGPIHVVGGKNISVGKGVVIEEHCVLSCQTAGSIQIGDYAYIARDVELKSEGILEIGQNCSLHRRTEITAVKKICLDENVWIARDCKLEGEEIRIHQDAILGPAVFMVTADHAYDFEAKRFQRFSAGNHSPIEVGVGSWVGAKSVVLKGVTIGNGSVIGAGSVVTKDIAPGQCAVGVPAAAKKALV